MISSSHNDMKHLLSHHLELVCPCFSLSLLEMMRSCILDGRRRVSPVEDGTLIAEVIADSLKVKKETDKL